MKDEIEEILDDIRFVAEEPSILEKVKEDDEEYIEEYDNFLYLTHKQDKILYDYITSLEQKVNKMMSTLKEEVSYLTPYEIYRDDVEAIVEKVEKIANGGE